MHAKIAHAAFEQQPAHRIRHAANADLQAVADVDFCGDEPPHGGVNVARRRGIEAEAAVRAANAKFRRRFASVERAAAAKGVALRDLDFAALDELWDAAKAEEGTR